MICPDAGEFVTPEFLREWRRRMFLERVPVSGTLELTRRCSLRCVHCYQGAARATGAGELSTEAWKRLLEQVAEAGCIFLVMTGGDPLVRADFPELYRYARGLGMLPTVFTNGVLLGDEHMRLFEEMPPRGVEVSLYGDSPEGYARMTGSAEAYGRAVGAVKRLTAAGIGVYAKTMLTTVNRTELDGIRQLAESLGCRFRFDAALFPEIDGGRGPLALRVGVDDAVACEFADARTAASWRDYAARVAKERGAAGVSEETHLYQCGAGRKSFYLDATGGMRPCVLAPYAVDAVGAGFGAAWAAVREWVEGRAMAADHHCRGCGSKHLCGYCPAFFALETGQEQGYSEYVCRLGDARRAAILAVEVV